ncbi:MAG: hypothetical protein D3922_14495, partial [Candidatus Electrothrix sp. AR1]|nr:hypothetical protein [Candidatus Electrothrix sp. AR1]
MSYGCRLDRFWNGGVLEKPIGRNLVSSRQINDLVARFFQENQIYRIDH